MKTTLLAGILPLLLATGASAAVLSPLSATAIEAAPSAQFMAALAQHCGQAFAGRVVANVPASATPDPFDGKALVMHVRGCETPERELRVPFHVGEDRSRTWVLTRVGDGLRLKHDHRQPDGKTDPLHWYGGDTVNEGTAERQEFPVDAESIALFNANDAAVSTTNVWAMEVHPDRMFAYELRRPNRHFRVEFDLTKPVAE